MRIPKQLDSMHLLKPFHLGGLGATLVLVQWLDAPFVLAPPQA